MPTLTSPQSSVPETDRSIVRPDDFDDPCLPDRARILRLLEANDGQLWQSEVVNELDVSKATVSRRLSDLEESSHIERMLFRGQNLVWLKDETPDVLGQPAQYA